MLQPSTSGIEAATRSLLWVLHHRSIEHPLTPRLRASYRLTVAHGFQEALERIRDPRELFDVALIHVDEGGPGFDVLVRTLIGSERPPSIIIVSSPSVPRGDAWARSRALGGRIEGWLHEPVAWKDLRIELQSACVRTDKVLGWCAIQSSDSRARAGNVDVDVAPERSLFAAARYLARPERLSPRELQVLAQLARGAPKRSISATLGVSYETVGSHVKALFGKTEVRSVIELVSAIHAHASSCPRCHRSGAGAPATDRLAASHRIGA